MKLVLNLLFFFFLLGCKMEKQFVHKKTIVCSTSIIRDCVQEIVGPEFKVISLMGPNIDPHSYKPRPSDIEKLITAEMIVYNGFHLEGKMPAVFEKLKSNHEVIAVSDFYDKKIAINADAHSKDPHIWFHVSAWTDALEEVKNKLRENYPKNRAEFDENFRNWKKKCTDLERFWKKKITQIPTNQRVLITSHDAFHYFGKAFNIKVRALQGVSTVQEANPRDLIKLIDFVVKNKIKSIFIESSVNPKTIERVLAGAKAKGATIKIGGMLYSDALGAENSGANTYLKMIQHNTSQIYYGLK